MNGEWLDVLIIGAGPAGSEMAYELSRIGWQVVVLEKMNLDREKSCGGGIQTQEVVEFGAIPEEILERNIGTARIYAPNAGHLFVPQYVPEFGATVKRAVFDVYLQNRAKEEGAQFFAHHEALDFEPVRGGVRVQVKTPEGIIHVNTRMMIYAAGATTSLLRKRYPTSRMNPERLYVAIEKWFEFEGNEVEERVGPTIEIYGGTNVVPGGYGWIFPKKNVLSVGIGTHKKVIADTGLNLRHLLDDFMYRHPIVSEKIRGGRIIRNDGGLIPAEPLDRLQFPNMILIGDAGGFGNVLHGGGIFQARKSAKIAAPFVDRFLHDNRHKHLVDYETEVKSYFWNYENRWDQKLVRFFWKDSLMDRVVSMANQGNEDLVKAFSIILNSTETHANAYAIFEQSMLDILYDFLKEQSKPYCKELEENLAAIRFADPLLAPAVNHLLFADAKRFRAIMAFFAFQIFDTDLAKAMPAALSYELLHTASLIHDDIGDNAVKRRGRNAVHVDFGVDGAITAGDSLIFKALQILHAAPWDHQVRSRVMGLFLDSAQAVCEGQALDIHLSRRFEAWSVDAHIEMIRGKTGALIESPLMAGAIIAGASEDQVQCLSRIGTHLGAAFQIIDDCNDFLRTGSTALKSLFTDIREGKCTLVLARAFECANEAERELMKRVIGNREADDAQIEPVLAICRQYDAIFYAQSTCGAMVKAAEADIASLPDNSARANLMALADMIGNWTSMGEERSEALARAKVEAPSITIELDELATDDTDAILADALAV